jgi:UDP:flavonoid glycosyltransferase YjiC (YdhE family)
MTHFGIICPAETGHLNTMLPLGRELQRRGHRVTLIGFLDAQAKTLAAGLGISGDRRI